MEISKLNNRAIEVTVEFNECSNFLKMTIERMPMIIYLHNFVYGELMHILNYFSVVDNILFEHN